MLEVKRYQCTVFTYSQTLDLDTSKNETTTTFFYFCDSRYDYIRLLVYGSINRSNPTGICGVCSMEFSECAYHTTKSLTSNTFDQRILLSLSSNPAILSRYQCYMLDDEVLKKWRRETYALIATKYGSSSQIMRQQAVIAYEAMKIELEFITEKISSLLVAMLHVSPMGASDREKNALHALNLEDTDHELKELIARQVEV